MPAQRKPGGDADEGITRSNFHGAECIGQNLLDRRNIRRASRYEEGINLICREARCHKKLIDAGADFGDMCIRQLLELWS